MLGSSVFNKQPYLTSALIILVALRKIPEGAHNTIVEALQAWTSWALLLFSYGTPDKLL